MAVSRTDLLQWLNDLLQLNYTKVEQCGAGGAYCTLDRLNIGSSVAGAPIDGK